MAIIYKGCHCGQKYSSTHFEVQKHAIEMFQPKRAFLFRAIVLICVSYLVQSALAQVDCETSSEMFVKITVKNFSNTTLGSFGDLRTSSKCNVPEVRQILL